MPVRPYQETTLWKSSFAGRKKGNSHQRERDNLSLAYEEFREIVAVLTNEIHAFLPNLTVHNVDHLDALWDVASEILGPNCSDINPMEAFILGRAFLLHDAGMALAVFPGRTSDLKREVRWRDAVVAAYRRRGVDKPSEREIVSLTPAIEQEAGFDVLRALHAEKAEGLAYMCWKHPPTNEEMPILPNTALRESHGHLIGKIAASHHWDVEEIPRRFADSPVVPTNPYPREWTIDPIKLACILRCADAANIDETRAPSYLYAMRRPGGVSDDHWGFQNQLLSTHRNHSALEFHSKSPFDEAQAGKWWLAHDCIRYLDKELTKCAALLEDIGRPAFPARRVAGAEDPNRLKQFIEVHGWDPVNTEIKSTSIKTLVECLGGEQLYGDNPIVPLRELIQNAADAIRARRVLDAKYYPSPSNRYPGEITVRVAEDSDDPAKVWISVEDDGVGMTQRVLTGQLLDFGKSLWRSDEVTEIYPGLSGSSEFRPTGQFGIGFFSVFMYSDYVQVISKPWHAGENALQTLAFPNGLKRRALLRGYKPDRDGPLKTNFSTKISMRVPLDKYIQMKRVSHYYSERTVSLASRLGRLCLPLDVKIFAENESGEFRCAHLPSYFNMNSKAFFYQLFMLEDEDELPEPLAAMVSFLRPLQDNFGRNLGRAVIDYRSIPWEYTGGVSVGGFLTKNTRSLWPYIGVLEGSSVSAARMEGTVSVPASVIQSWASEQARLIGVSDLDPFRKVGIAESICSCGGDASPVAYIWFNGKQISLNQCVELLEERGFVNFIVGGQEPTMRIENFPSELDVTGELPNLAHRPGTFIAPVRVELLSNLVTDVCHALLSNELMSSQYWCASSDYEVNLASNCFLRYFLTRAEERGLRLCCRVDRKRLLGRYKEHDIYSDLLVIEVVN